GRVLFVSFLSSRRRHTSFSRDWSSDVCSSDLRSHVVELGETILDRFHDEPFQVLRVGARVDRGDEEGRYLEERILLARHAREREPAHDDQTEKGDERELIATYRKFEQAHDSVSFAMRRGQRARESRS